MVINLSQIEVKQLLGLAKKRLNDDNRVNLKTTLEGTAKIRYIGRSHSKSWGIAKTTFAKRFKFFEFLNSY